MYNLTGQEHGQGCLGSDVTAPAFEKMVDEIWDGCPTMFVSADTIVCLATLGHPLFFIQRTHSALPHEDACLDYITGPDR